MSTAYSSTISTVIEDLSGYSGSLTKEGSGTLDLQAINTYTGDTTVTATGGTLQMEYPYLADTSAVRLFTGGTLNLNTSGAIDTIAALYFDNSSQASGTWGATGSGAAHTDARITGSGWLNVTAVPEPSTLILLATGLLGLLVWAWRRRRA